MEFLMQLHKTTILVALNRVEYEYPIFNTGKYQSVPLISINGG